MTVLVAMYAAEAMAMRWLTKRWRPSSAKNPLTNSISTRWNGPPPCTTSETKQVEFVRATGIHVAAPLRLRRRAGRPVRLLQCEQIRQDAELRHAIEPESLGHAGVQELRHESPGHPAAERHACASTAAIPTGSLEFIGENAIDHTPKDETLRIYTGNAFDIVGERKRTNYHVESSQHWMDETFEIRVRNHKKEAVNVRVVEHLYRCNNWKLAEQSTQSRKMDAQTVEFPVTSQPDGERRDVHRALLVVDAMLGASLRSLLRLENTPSQLPFLWS